MTYMFDGRQFIAVAAGPSIIAFALPLNCPNEPVARIRSLQT